MTIKRNLLGSLRQWKTQKLRKPLIIRGARQVGKSYLIRQFALEFDGFVEINFEKDKHAQRLFEGSLEPAQLIQKIKAYTDQLILPGKTLLFFDEIQECEQAIVALRYFKEEMPGLHVVAAGSLIDFKLKNIGVPVGRVQFLYLYPLSFAEYCTAVGCEQLYQEAQIQLKLDTPLHERLLEEIKRYSWLGGMPAVIEAWKNHHDYALCKELQDDLVLAYRQDFNKYAKTHQVPHVERLFFHAGQQLGQKFKYTTVDPEARAAILRDALELLEMAGIVYRVFHSAGQDLPLAAGMDDRRFKVYFFDIGLTQRLLGVTIKDWLLKPIAVKHLGSITEQLVLQEYIAYTSHHSPPELFYWHKESPKSNAEVDFLFIKEGKIIPIEVKSGSSGHLKSLQSFLATHPHVQYGLKISEARDADFGSIHSIPFYAISGWLLEGNFRGV